MKHIALQLSITGSLEDRDRCILYWMIYQASDCQKKDLMRRFPGLEAIRNADVETLKELRL